MKEMEYLEELTGRYPVLEAVKEDIRAAYELLKDCYEQGGKAVSYTHLDVYKRQN